MRVWYVCTGPMGGQPCMATLVPQFLCLLIYFTLETTFSITSQVFQKLETCHESHTYLLLDVSYQPNIPSQYICSTQYILTLDVSRQTNLPRSSSLDLDWGRLTTAHLISSSWSRLTFFHIVTLQRPRHQVSSSFVHQGHREHILGTIQWAQI